MYIPAIGLFIVDIPKNGSSTIRKAVTAAHDQTTFHGHIPVSIARQELGDVDAWALIRDPVERFTSAINFVYGKGDIHFDDAMNGALRHSTVVLKPQADFIDAETLLFPFEQMEAMLRLIGVQGPLPHENQSQKRWSVSDVLSHSRGWEVLDRYAQDQEIRGTVNAETTRTPEKSRS